MKSAPFAWVIPVALGLGLSLSSCRTDHAEQVPVSTLDLSPYSIPIIIKAPDSAEVIVKDYSIMRDITIRRGDDFDLQLYELATPKNDAAGEKLRQLATVKEAPFFKEVIREDDQGFIYSMTNDSTSLEYDFRYVRLVGDKEIIFQTGLTRSFDLDDVIRMYNAVK